MPNPNISELGKKYGGRNLGAKNKKTIAKEQAREAFDKVMLEKFQEMNIVSRTEGLKPENRQERQYITDQVIGRPIETKKVELDIDLDLGSLEEL